MTNANPIRSTAHVTLDLPPSCMQFSPIDPEYFVVGTYNLVNNHAQPTSAPVEENDDCQLANGTTKVPQSRNGSLLLFRIVDTKLNLVQTEPQPSALLDLRFHPQHTSSESFLATVSSTGSLAIHTLEHHRGAVLRQVATSRCEDNGEEVLFLQCNWHPSVRNVIAVTTSTGLARILYLNANWSIDGWTDLNIRNSLEAWSISFSGPGCNTKERGNGRQLSTTIYCGGDDSVLRYTSCDWPETTSEQKVNTSYPAMAIKGQHNAGVTAILPLSCWTPDGGRIVLTGSYDDHLRIFSIQDLHESYGAKKVRLMGDINLGGGVWRLNVIDVSQTEDIEIRILASCMHAGARIVTITIRDGRILKSAIVARFEEHKSMNYASDSTKLSQSGGLRCISTSFYDKLLCLWDFDPLVNGH